MAKPRRSRWILGLILGVTVLVAGACGRSQSGSGSGLSGSISADGSSTVFPITEAMAEEFGKENRDVRITVGISGTGGGFKKFCSKDTVISDASRPIKESERKSCADAGVEYIELPVAFDGLSVLVNPSNDWLTEITVEDLKKIWEPSAQGKITKWNQVRPEWPDKPLVLFGPGTDSGTYDYFTEAVVGEEGKSRGDFTGSEDDNVLVQGISGDPNSLGFFGYAYYEENASKLKLIPVVNPATKAAVSPSPETINDGTYYPLSRPLFIYVAKAVSERPDVKAFIDFYLSNPDLVSSTGFIAFPESLYKKIRTRYANGTTGSIFEKGSQTGVRLEDLLREEG